MLTTITNPTNYLVYTADPWKPDGSFKLWGTVQNKTLAEGLRYELIRRGTDKPENIHILPVDANEAEAGMEAMAA